jgi:predicted DNA binding CopG/RHH family protein
MRKEYDLSNAVRNPYTKLLKKQITIRLETETIDYFKSLSKEVGVPYQTLIDMYLTDCAMHKKKLQWAA